MVKPPNDPTLLPTLAARSGTSWSTKTVPERHQEVIRLLECHVPLREIATITSYSVRTIQYIVQRYRTLGRAALRDGRMQGQRMRGLLTPSMQRELQALLQYPPPDDGRWTGPKVASWMTARTGKPVARQRGWEYLHRFRPANADATDPRDDPTARESETS